jgi:hypothetical protein
MGGPRAGEARAWGVGGEGEVASGSLGVGAKGRGRVRGDREGVVGVGRGLNFCLCFSSRTYF